MQELVLLIVSVFLVLEGLDVEAHVGGVLHQKHALVLLLENEGVPFVSVVDFEGGVLVVPFFLLFDALHSLFELVEAIGLEEQVLGLPQLALKVFENFIENPFFLRLRALPALVADLVQKGGGLGLLFVFPEGYVPDFVLQLLLDVPLNAHTMHYN